MRNFTLSLILLLAVGAQARAQSQTLGSNIRGFAKITSGIYRGGVPSAEDLSELAQLGIKTDLSVQGGDLDNPGLEKVVLWWEPSEAPEVIALEKQNALSLGMEFVNLPLNSLAPVDAQEDARIDQALDLMANPAAQPVFVHCERGKDRTGLLIALFRVKYQHWTAKAAHQEWVDAGHGKVSAWFTGGLDDYFYQKAATFQK